MTDCRLAAASLTSRCPREPFGNLHAAFSYRPSCDELLPEPWRQDFVSGPSIVFSSDRLQTAKSNVNLDERAFPAVGSLATALGDAVFPHLVPTRCLAKLQARAFRSWDVDFARTLFSRSARRVTTNKRTFEKFLEKALVLGGHFVQLALAGDEQRRSRRGPLRLHAHFGQLREKLRRIVGTFSFGTFSAKSDSILDCTTSDVHRSARLRRRRRRVLPAHRP